jgi:hypothetical protein
MMKTMPCNKKTLGSNYFSPGLLHWSCAHERFRGGMLLRDHESPRHLMEMCLDRLNLKLGPGEDWDSITIVYDNGCNFFKYCLRREAGAFGGITVYIDRLHSRNHCACQLCQHMGYYKYDGHTLKHINSQVVEQLNSLLKPLRKKLAFMSGRHAVAFLKDWFARWNERKTARRQAQGK